MLVKQAAVPVTREGEAGACSRSEGQPPERPKVPSKGWVTSIETVSSHHFVGTRGLRQRGSRWLQKTHRTVSQVAPSRDPRAGPGYDHFTVYRRRFDSSSRYRVQGCCGRHESEAPGDADPAAKKNTRCEKHLWITISTKIPRCHLLCLTRTNTGVRAVGGVTAGVAWVPMDSSNRSHAEGSRRRGTTSQLRSLAHLARLPICLFVFPFLSARETFGRRTAHRVPHTLNASKAISVDRGTLTERSRDQEDRPATGGKKVEEQYTRRAMVSQGERYNSTTSQGGEAGEKMARTLVLQSSGIYYPPLGNPAKSVVQQESTSRMTSAGVTPPQACSRAPTGVEASDEEGRPGHPRTGTT